MERPQSVLQFSDIRQTNYERSEMPRGSVQEGSHCTDGRNKRWRVEQDAPPLRKDSTALNLKEDTLLQPCAGRSNIIDFDNIIKNSGILPQRSMQNVNTSASLSQTPQCLSNATSNTCHDTSDSVLSSLSSMQSTLVQSATPVLPNPWLCRLLD